MGGFVVVPQEPGPAMAGHVFRSIPASGVLTDGDDTLIGSWVTDFAVSGGQGNDLLVLDYTGSLVRLELDAALGFMGIQDADYIWLASGTVQDFERFRLTGGALDDTIRGGWDGGATLSGGAGDDLITMRGGNNLVRGGSGSDSIYGATLSDTVSGGAGVGTDVLFLDLSDATGPVSLRAGTNFGTWTGFEHYAGTLTRFDDTLVGGALLWEADGGDGVDELWLNYSALDTRNPGTSISFDGGFGGFATIGVNWPDEFPTYIFLQDFERFRVTGTAHGDFMIGGAGGDVLRGQGGNDTLSGGSGRDSLFGGAGDDVLSGNLGAASLLSGGSGDDTINASRLDDTIIGGDGFDRLQLDFWDASAGVRIDLVSGMPDWRGIEAISGELSRHDDLFRARVLTGTLDGGAGVDTLVLDYSRSGAEGVSFRFGLLTVAKDGLTQRQTASGFERFDLRGSAGGDSLIGDDLADVLQGLGGDDWLGGRGGRDLLRGGAGNDTLFGGAGDDTLDGGPGRDTLDGSTGNDVLTGGTGRDTFWFRGAAPGNDIITDFEAGLDRILIDPRHGPAPLVQSGADVLIDLSGQTLRVLNANLAEVQAAIDFADLVLA